MMEAVCTSETSINFYEATGRNIPEGILMLVTVKPEIAGGFHVFPQAVHSNAGIMS
jgi:hypothetical protein